MATKKAAKARKGTGRAATRRQEGADHAVRAVPIMPISCLCLLGVALGCVIGGAADGLSLSDVSGTLLWFFAAGIAVVYAQLGALPRAKVLRVAGYVGVGCCAISLLILCGALPMAGGMWNGRLQFVMGYANTAAALFAGFWFVQRAVGDARLDRLSFFSMAMLLFTQSVGMMGMFVIAAVALIAWRMVKRDFSCVFDVLAQALFASVSFIVCQVAAAFWAVLAVPVVFGLYVAVWRLVRRRCGGTVPCALMVAMLVLVTGAVIFVVAAAAFAGRVPQALGTFSERLIQMHDGWTMLMESPVLGWGPDGWPFDYRRFQSTQYSTLYVHNGYLQLWLDGGLFGLACFLAFAVLGVRTLWKRRETVLLIGAVMLLAHLFVDIDLEYGLYLMLLVFLLVPPGLPRLPRKAAGPAVAASLVLSCAGCAAALVAQNAIDDGRAAANRGSYEHVEAALKGNPLAQVDPQMRAAYVAGLAVAGQYDRAVQAFKQWGSMQSEGVQNAAYAYLQKGDAAAATDTVLTQLEQEPGRHAGFEFARYVLYAADADDAAWQRYAASARHANQLMEEHPGDAAAKRREPEALTEDDRARFDAKLRGESVPFAYEETYWTGAE